MNTVNQQKHAVLHAVISLLAVLHISLFISVSDAEAIVKPHKDVEAAYANCKDRPMLKELIAELEKSNHKFYINEEPPKPLPKVRTEPHKITNSTIPEIGSGADIFWRVKGDPMQLACREACPGVVGGVVTEDENRCASLFHELRHALMIMEGRHHVLNSSMNSPRDWYDMNCTYEDEDGHYKEINTPANDVEVVRAENEYRRLNGLPERCCYHYDPDKEGGLIDQPLPPADKDCVVPDKWKKRKPRTPDSEKTPLDIPQRHKVP